MFLKNSRPSLQKQNLTFSNQQLIRLILPLIAEQFLAILVGVADTLMVSGVGESAVAAVSMVDILSILFVQFFSAMCTGGAIVAAQYLGNKDHPNACNAAKQLLLFTILLSSLISVLIILFHRQVIGLMDDNSDPAVFEQACTYLLITACSYPFLGIYNASAGLMRAMGNSKTSMWTSIIMNIVNVGGNAILIHPCGMGVAGAATATLLSRAVASMVTLRLMFRPSQPIHLPPLDSKGFFHLDLSMIKRIFNLGLPSGIETSLFQVGRVLIMGIIATFPTAIRAANGICNSVSSLAVIPFSGISLATVTVIGQLIGGDKKEEARYYAKKLLMLMYVSIFPLNVGMFLWAEPLVRLFNLTEAGIPAAVEALRCFAIFTIFFYGSSFGTTGILRAAGDTRYAMYVSIPSMLLVRVGMSYLLVYVFHMSLLGIWLSMCLDWVVRSICFVSRLRGDVWLNKKAI